ncbi:isoamylase early set domain-containing protein [Marinomonas sp.]
MIEKKFLKTKPECKIKFSLPADVIGDAKSISVVGDFNDWDPVSHPMRKQKNGLFSCTVNLAVASAYQFRYLLDSNQWLNDDQADSYATSPISHEENGVLSL